VKRNKFILSLSMDVLEMVELEASRLGITRQAMVRNILGEWAKTHGKAQAQESWIRR